MKKNRKQLTLFLNQEDSSSIEFIRKKFNPIQFQLIKSHITLCREDEIENLKIVLNNLSNLNINTFELGLGGVKRVSEDKGVLIQVNDDKLDFQNLRTLVLKNSISKPRIHKPHITLMHSRNSTCTNLIFEEIKKIELPEKVRISNISLIEQEIGKEWKELKRFYLKN